MPLTPEEARELLEQFLTEPIDTSPDDNGWIANRVQLQILHGARSEELAQLHASITALETLNLNTTEQRAQQSEIIQELTTKAQAALEEAKQAVARSTIPDIWHWRPEHP